MFRNFLLVFVLLLLSIKGFSNSPQTRCVSVLANGNVTLTWSIPTITVGTFDSYQIFTSANFNGPYTLLTTINNINQTTYTDVAANANAAKVYYFNRN